MAWLVRNLKTKRGQFLGQTRATLVLGGEDDEFRARTQRPQRQRHFMPPLKRVGWCAHDEAVTRFRRQLLERRRARYQRRNLHGIALHRNEVGRDVAVEEVCAHCGLLLEDLSSRGNVCFR